MAKPSFTIGDERCRFFTSLITALLLSLFCFWHLINAEIKYSVDVSFMVADLKYSKTEGIKICEVQQGFDSTFDEDVILFGLHGTICPKFAHFFASLPSKKWASGINFTPFRMALSFSGWIVHQPTSQILKDPQFLSCALTLPKNPSSIASYGGIFYCPRQLAKHGEPFFLNYPGILFIDAAITPYSKDKSEISRLFTLYPELNAIKAEWKLYPCKYTHQLAIEIQTAIAADVYVIKPKKEALGRGVIIVAKEDLDETLKIIFEPDHNLKNHPDESFAYWAKSCNDAFIIEKFYSSDPLQIPLISKKLKGEMSSLVTYDPTLRVGFLLIYNEEKISCRCLGGYWRIPKKSFEEGGTLNELRKDYSSLRHCCCASDEVLDDVFLQLENKMPLLYQSMLEQR